MISRPDVLGSFFGLLRWDHGSNTLLLSTKRPTFRTTWRGHSPPPLWVPPITALQPRIFSDGVAMPPCLDMCWAIQSTVQALQQHYSNSWMASAVQNGVCYPHRENSFSLEWGRLEDYFPRWARYSQTWRSKLKLNGSRGIVFQSWTPTSLLKSQLLKETSMARKRFIYKKDKLRTILPFIPTASSSCTRLTTWMTTLATWGTGHSTPETATSPFAENSARISKEAAAPHLQ